MNVTINHGTQAAVVAAMSGLDVGTPYDVLTKDQVASEFGHLYEPFTEDRLSEIEDAGGIFAIDRSNEVMREHGPLPLYEGEYTHVGQEAA